MLVALSLLNAFASDADMRLNPSAIEKYDYIAVVQTAGDLTDAGTHRSVSCQIKEAIKGGLSGIVSFDAGGRPQETPKTVGSATKAGQYLILAAKAGAAVGKLFDLPTGKLAAGQDVPARLYNTFAVECTMTDNAIVAEAVTGLGNSFVHTSQVEKVEGVPLFQWINHTLVPKLEHAAARQTPHNALKIHCLIARGDISTTQGDAIVKGIIDTERSGEHFDDTDDTMVGQVDSQMCHSGDDALAAFEGCTDPHIRSFILTLNWQLGSARNFNRYKVLLETEQDLTTLQNLIGRVAGSFGISVPSTLLEYGNVSRQQLDPYIAQITKCTYADRKKAI